MTFKVFVSHTAQANDLLLINEILQRSAVLGIQCYMAEHDTSAGIELKEKLKARIAEANCVLVLVTKATADSDWVKWEIA